MIKILWCTIDRSARAGNYNDWFYYELSKHKDIDLHVFKRSLPVRPGAYSKNKKKLGDILAKDLKKFLTKHKDYDLIVFDEWSTFFDGSFLKQIKIPKAIILEDQHKDVDHRAISLASKNGYYVFHRYFLNKFAKSKINPERAFWLPHSFEPMIYKDYKLKKEYGFLQTGTASKLYVFRVKVANALGHYKFYKRIDRPTKDKTLDKIENSCVFAYGPFDFEYAMELNKSYMSLATGSLVNYPVAKYNEIAACNSVIYSNWYPELSSLGYRKNYNMIAINDGGKGDIRSQVKGLMADKDNLLTIAKRGYNLVHKRHTNKVRVREFVSIIKNII